MMVYVLIAVLTGWKTVLTWMSIFIVNLMKWIVPAPFVGHLSLTNVESVVEMDPWNTTTVRVLVYII